MFDALAIFGATLDRKTITRAVALADAFVLQHRDTIPADVIARWKELRSALIDWKETL